MYPRPYANYTLLERLATGGMSEVDLARRAVDDAGFVRFLVVKRIRANHAEDQSFVRMFKDEARITSELRHTHIAQVYDFGRVGDEYYLALEYVPGTDLRAVLALLRKARQRMPVRMALRVAHDVLDALHYAHTRTDGQGRPMRIVHRDVNPRNIMLSIAGEVKLIDFGVARAADRLERTQTDHFKGKVAYMAPEQIKGGDLDQRVDVFALGLTLYEMLVGAGPFAGLEQTQILFKILQGDLPNFAVPKEWGGPGRDLAAVVNRALRPDPADRFADADAMRRAVAKVADSFGGLPTTAELRAWLGELDPDLERKVRAKLDTWSGPIALGPAGEPALVDDAHQPLDASGTLDRQRIAAPIEGTGSLSRTVAVTAGVGAATVLVGAGAVLLVAVVFLLAALGPSVWRNAGAGDPPTVAAVADPPPTSRLDDPGPAPAASSSAEPTRPLTIGKVAGPPEPVPGPAPQPSALPTRPAVTASTGAAPTAPTDTPKVAIVEVPQEPSPVERPVEPAPIAAVVAPPPTTTAPTATAPTTTAPIATALPEPAPAPRPPVATKVGFLQVSSEVRELTIVVDGKKTTFATPKRFEWPVGEYTVSVDGHAPQSVTVREGMVTTVVLKR